MDVKAVIFDLDGVVVSTDNHHYSAWKRLANEEGIYFDRKINERLRGVSRLESLGIILEKANKLYSLEDRKNMCDKKNSYYLDLISELTEGDILPGVNEFMGNLIKRNIKMAVASSSRNASYILEKVGLFDSFGVVITGNDVRDSKPNPEIFLLASDRLGVDPEYCFVIEDADVGVEAALAGGMRVVGIGYASNNSRATLTRNDLSFLSFNNLLS